MTLTTWQIIDNVTDPLWTDYIGHTQNPTIIDLAANCHFPSWRDIKGWRSLLMAERPSRVMIWQPGPHSVPLITILNLMDIDIRVILTRPLIQPSVLLLNTLRFQINRIICYSRSIAKQATALGIDPTLIRLRTVQTKPFKYKPDMVESIRKRINPEGPIILGLPEPSDINQLTSIIWSAALAWHARPSLKLILAGRVPPEVLKGLDNLTDSWNCRDMMHLDNSTPWCHLVEATDLILDGQYADCYPLRLHCAFQCAKPILTGDQTCKPQFENQPDFICLNDASPRNMAGMILKLTDQVRKEPVGRIHSLTGSSGLSSLK